MQTTTITPKALTASEAAHRLGIKKETLVKLIKSGRLPACRVSARGDFRLDRRVVDDFLTGQL